MTKDTQRVVVCMLDGFGMDYFGAQPLPTLQRMAAQGFFRPVNAIMPSVTNANNVSICCGAYPEDHGITGNSYFNEQTGEADYMESAAFLLESTMIQRAAARGIASALLTSKKKTINLLGGGATIAVAAEEPPPAFRERYGAPASIYSREINYWLWEVATDLLATRPDLGLLYVHTTDYPMHAWAPEAPESQEHLTTLDTLLGKALAAAPDAAFLVTADHGMNYKTRCWDLEKACAERGMPLRFALSAEKDRYVRHHRTFGGTAWVWLRAPDDAERVATVLRGLEGVEQVLSRSEAARRFRLPAERIGELVVLGDKETVFGEMPEAYEELDARYRSHGSLHELAVPLIAYNHGTALPPQETITANLDLTRALYRD
ncbi:MAG TPA: alkaline phosphatase family protein [Chloroflexota bacterium]|nr:alkaline phosphatase family protein [Chloroflexota bacterium]